MPTRHRLYLADSLWLISHDEYTGKSRIRDRALGLALAGSLLGELVLHGNIILTNTDDVEVRKLDPPMEVVANTVFQQIMRERMRPSATRVTSARNWLNYLSEYAEDWVTRRLGTIGMVEEVSIRRFLRLRPETRHRVVNVNDAVTPAVTLSSTIRGRSPLAIHETAFAGFAQAAGLRKWLLFDVDDAARSYLHRQLECLPWSLSSLIAVTDAAVGEAVLTHRI